MNYIKAVDRHQSTFMNRLDDLVSQANPVRILDLIVDKIIQGNPAQFMTVKTKGQKQKGRPAYSPYSMHKLYLYGYLNSIRSSRRLEKECGRNIEMIWLLGDLRPDFKTIADFRKDNREQIVFLNKKVREFLRDSGYIKGKRIGIDGSKMKANARREMLNMEKIEKRLSKMSEKIEDYLSKLADNDVTEDIYEELEELDSTPAMNQHLLDKVINLQKEVEKLQYLKTKLEKEDRNYISATDEEANLMKSQDGLVPAYNFQIAVHSENDMIAACDVSTKVRDSKLLRPMLGKLKEDLDIEPDEALADKGYADQPEIEKIEENSHTECYVPFNKEKEEEIEFTCDKEKDEYICSEGKRLVLKQKKKKRRGLLYKVYQGIECEGCLIRSKCTSSKYGRMLHRSHKEEWRRKYKTRLSSKKGKQLINQRKTLVEHPFGTIRYWMGKIPLLLRGRDKVITEMNIFVTAYNIRRLLTISTFDELLEKMNKYNWAIA